jgi:hypothetical protein
MKGEELAVTQEDCWRNIAITLVDRVVSAMAVKSDLFVTVKEVQQNLLAKHQPGKSVLGRLILNFL